MHHAKSRSSGRAIAIGSSATATSLLPLFLTGALSVQLRRDLGFGTIGLGIAIGAFRASSASLSPHLGKVVDRLGARRAIRLAAAITGTTSVGIALGARSFALLVACLMLGGCAQAIAPAAANRLLVNIVPRHRLGTAFGMKQSAPPVASMIAGLSVPVIALTIGWRWAFAFGGALAFSLLAVVRLPTAKRLATGASARRPLRPQRSATLLVVLPTALALGSFASASITAFYVDTAVRQGGSQALAALVLAIGSLAAIGVRLLAGVVSDRLKKGHLRLCSCLILLGAVGMTLIAQGTVPLSSAGAVIGLAGAWGFPGVFFFAVVRSHPESPGAVTGIVLPGALIGSTVGPVTFGVVAEAASYAAAWRVGACVAIVAAALMVVAGVEIDRWSEARK